MRGRRACRPRTPELLGGPLARRAPSLRERTHTLARRSAVELAPGRLRVRDGGVELDVAFEEGAGIQAVCPHGAATCGRASRRASPPT